MTVFRPVASVLNVLFPPLLAILLFNGCAPRERVEHLDQLAEKEFAVPVRLDNDANCFAYGEKIFGKGKTYENFVGITLGTGVGGGIIQQRSAYMIRCGLRGTFLSENTEVEASVNVDYQHQNRT